MRRIKKALALQEIRDHRQERRARTRRLIELGGLVVKAGLVELTNDDRPALLGSFQEMADRLRGAPPEILPPADLMARWRRRGLDAFAVNAAAKTAHREAKQAHASAAPNPEGRKPGDTRGPDPRGLEPSRSQDP